ncbi:MAG: amidase family protein [Burkholderiaceae bacterium]
MLETCFRSASSLVRLLRSGKMSSVDLLEQTLARVRRHNPTLNPIVWLDEASAMRQAKAADAALARGEATGPLHGLPMTVKESLDIAGAPTSNGDPALRDNIATGDALAVQRLRAAGAIIFGKTNLPLHMVEWQTFNAIHGTTLNPWDLSVTPGGSSGGSAVALAAGLTHAEVGSDIGSSIRNPAHYCGVFGLKPTWGLLPLRGHGGGAFSEIDIGVIGPMTRHAVDLDLLLAVLAGPDTLEADAWRPRLPRCRVRSLAHFRIAVKLDDPMVDTDDAYADQRCDGSPQNWPRLAPRCPLPRPPAIDSAQLHQVYPLLRRAATSDGVPRPRSIELEDALKTPKAGPMRCCCDRWSRGTGSAMPGGWRWTGSCDVAPGLGGFFRTLGHPARPAAASAAWPINERGERWQRMIRVNGRAVPETDQLFWSGYSGVALLPSVVGPCGFVGHLPRLPGCRGGHGHDRTATAFARCVEREIVGFTPPPDLGRVGRLSPAAR